MKHLKIIIVLTVLCSMARVRAFAYDIEVKNADGVTIYYNYINGGKELEVTYKESGNSGYRHVKMVHIPDSVTFMNRTRKVTSIGNSAFEHTTSLESVVIPNNVITIGDNVFSDCFGLTSINIPNSVISIGDGAFMDCKSLAAISIPNSVTSIGKHAFKNCQKLLSVIISDGMTIINEGTFDGCCSIISIDIPNTINKICDDAFCFCTSLTSISFSEGLVGIGCRAFTGCDSLKTVSIPNSVTSVGWAAFDSCKSLSSLTIGNGIQSIGERAFYCDNLISVTSFIANPPKGYNMGADVFSKNTYYNGTLIVPKGTKGLYKETEGWKDFIWIEEAEDINNGVNKVNANAIIIQSNDGQMTFYCADDGTMISVYGINGIQAGAGISKNGQAIINTNLSSGEIGIVKIGEKTIKILIK